MLVKGFQLYLIIGTIVSLIDLLINWKVYKILKRNFWSALAAYVINQLLWPFLIVFSYQIIKEEKKVQAAIEKRIQRAKEAYAERSYKQPEPSGASSSKPRI